MGSFLSKSTDEEKIQIKYNNCKTNCDPWFFVKYKKNTKEVCLKSCELQQQKNISTYTAQKEAEKIKAKREAEREAERQAREAEREAERQAREAEREAERQATRTQRQATRAQRQSTRQTRRGGRKRKTKRVNGKSNRQK